ncbi:MAG: CCA tRNA nucleotidyltransferase, partial [Planctomycetota bacterium]
DASRRDFTINAFYLDIETREIFDFFGGLRDLEEKIIRAIGEPRKRFEEDNLRMLRAVRFATQLGFCVEKETFDTIKDLAHNILNISWERIREEFKLIITMPNRKKGLELLDQSNLLQYILPEVVAGKGVPQPPDFHPEGDVFTHSLLSVEKLESFDFSLSFATLLHDIGKIPTFQVADRIRFNNHDNIGAQMAEKVAERFKLSNKEKEKIVWLIRNHLIFKDIKNMRLSKIKRLFNEAYYSELELLYKADKLAANGDLSDYEYTVNLRKTIPPEKPRPIISGDDLIELGLQPSPLFKKILNHISDLQLENKIKTKEQAIEEVRKIIDNNLII